MHAVCNHVVNHQYTSCYARAAALKCMIEVKNARTNSTRIQNTAAFQSSLHLQDADHPHSRDVSLALKRPYDTKNHRW